MDSQEQKILQRRLAKFLVGEVFNTITSEDILRVKTPTIWLYKGKELTEGQVKQLRNQATAMYNSDLWKMIRDELRYYAQKKTMEEGQTESDLISGKMLQYLTDIVDSRLKSMIQEK